MAHVRRALILMFATVMAIGPVGSAIAASRVLHVSPAQAMNAQPHQTHSEHHERAALPASASQTQGAHKYFVRTNSGDCCCGDHKANCAETCLHKCFGQLGLISSDRFARAPVLDSFVGQVVVRPPDWVHGPQTPPPRA